MTKVVQNSSSLVGKQSAAADTQLILVTQPPLANLNTPSSGQLAVGGSGTATHGGEPSAKKDTEMMAPLGDSQDGNHEDALNGKQTVQTENKG